MATCEYVTPTGVCGNRTRGRDRFCKNHQNQAKSNILGQYRIAKHVLNNAPERHADAEQLKSVRGEIAILRALLEARLNLISNDAELVAATPLVKDLALAVDKLATSCHNMDVKLGNLLNKSALLALAQEQIRIIERHLRPLVNTAPTPEAIDELLEQIGRETVEAIAKMENSDG